MMVDMARKVPKPWQPLSARMAGKPPDLDLEEGVPDWLDSKLRFWLRMALDNYGLRDRLSARFRVVDVGRSVVETLDPVTLLDWVDAALHISKAVQSEGSHAYDARSLEDTFREGRSVWRVNDKQDGLEHRQDRVVTDAVRTAADRGPAAEHLRRAWNKTYALHPDPSKAYQEAILAVEAAAIPVVQPTNMQATLGHVLGQLDRQGHLYEAVITDKSGAAASVVAATELVRLLWEGHTDRHEGNRPAIPISQEAAEMAVHLAATLVAWFSSGAVRRKSR